MIILLEPFAPEEAQLFAKLPLNEWYLGFGAVGHVQAELELGEFYHMWCPEDKRLATFAFRREWKRVLRVLRGKNGVFQSASALSDCLRLARSLSNGDRGFRLRTAKYSYYVRCHATERDGYDITIYAYDNALLLPTLTGNPALGGKDRRAR